MDGNTFVAVGTVVVGLSMVGFVRFTSGLTASIVSLAGVVGGLAVAATGVLRLASVEPFTGDVSSANVVSTAIGLLLVGVAWLVAVVTSWF